MINPTSNWRAILSVVISLGVWTSPALAQPAPKLPSEELIREKLDTWDPIYHPKELDDLVALGEKALPTYLRIANDPKINFIVRARLFGVVQRIKGDRHEFVEPALTSLGSKECVAGLHLLAEIGSSKDTPPMVALLWADEVMGISSAATAAETIAAVGSDRDLLAFDIWLKSREHKFDKEIRPYVQKSRDKLAKRIEQQKKK